MRKRIKRDVAKLLRKFSTTGFKNGDLVITAEIHRVVDKDWGRNRGVRGMEVIDEWPNPSLCARIMQTGRGGQHCIMRLKQTRQKL